MIDFSYLKQVEKWGIQEIVCQGYSTGNPFIDFHIKGRFSSKNQSMTVDGFYDGNGIYKVRFMPSFEEEYSFEITGNFSDVTYCGSFTVTCASINNHGPVRTANTYHFAYEDGTPYYPVGTTCYVWQLQPENIQELTLETLKNNAFNKIRFCIFPKHYDYNFKEPILYPYIGTPCNSSKITKENFAEYYSNFEGNNWDFKRFNAKYFSHLEDSIGKLCDLSIEADLILMHPYDRWGFSSMDKECDELYLRYIVARFAAYRNVWWSLANEYDLMPQKSLEDWEEYARIVCDCDPYSHLRSIHNCRPFYNYMQPWITHCCIQRQDLYKSAEFVAEWRECYKKPVVLDEIAYEGNIQHGWGNISGKELVRRFWEAACRGGYAGHGETFLHSDDILWWSHGGELHGESPERLKFLHKIMCETPGVGLMPAASSWDEVAATTEGGAADAGKANDYYIYYYSFMRPSFRDFYLDDYSNFDIEVIDTWEMTIEKRGIFCGKFRIDLPGKEYMAVRIRKV